jgi:RNA polymerase sigma-70 factor, ECF subfamily
MIAEEQRLRSLLVAGLGGDAAAYREFLTLTTLLARPFVARQLRRMGRAESDAEDIVQETIIAIHSKAHTYDSSAPVTAWIHAIARYKTIDFLRASRNRTEDVPLSELEAASTPFDDRAEKASVLLATISSLPANLRLPLQLTKFDGLSVAEASVRTGMSQSAVKVAVHRAIKALTSILGSKP